VFLGEQRARHRDAAAQRARRLRGHQRLSAQHAVLVGEREAHQLELLAADGLGHGRGCTRLRLVPEAVPIDETQSERSALM
jgi:hypothetical protein